MKTKKLLFVIFFLKGSLLLSQSSSFSEEDTTSPLMMETPMSFAEKKKMWERRNESVDPRTLRTPRESTPKEADHTSPVSCNSLEALGVTISTYPDETYFTIRKAGNILSLQSLGELIDSNTFDASNTNRILLEYLDKCLREKNSSLQLREVLGTEIYESILQSKEPPTGAVINWLLRAIKEKLSPSPIIPVVFKLSQIEKPSIPQDQSKNPEVEKIIFTAAARSYHDLTHPYEEADKLWAQTTEQGWSKRISAKIKEEERAAILEQSKQKLAAAKEEVKDKNPEETFLGKVGEGLKVAKGEIQSAVGTLLSSANNLIFYRKVYYYTGEESYSSWQYNSARREYEAASQEAPNLQLAAQEKEQKALEDEAKKSLNLAHLLHPKGNYDQWAESLIASCHLKQTLSTQLALQAKADLQWVEDQISAAWNERMNSSKAYLAALESESSEETSQLQRLQAECIKALEDSNKHEEIAKGAQTECEELEKRKSLAEEELKKAEDTLTALQKTSLLTSEIQKKIAAQENIVTALNEEFQTLKKNLPQTIEEKLLLDKTSQQKKRRVQSA